ncbi:hypothetical protein HIM_12213 [Hirsutella minnesotensis 3608]|uniref:Triacylglycerol lipase n=1 Tax=Hirsutella minnesotensis 3608 TaxID=1043627 RepID=A0A0F7ZW58_9HYPO|nr:hypothetical protein HIM_12213 [Hirsutella minnesotensis 3608]
MFSRLNSLKLAQGLLLILVALIKADPLTKPAPAKDPFYHPPKNIDNLKPGAIIRHRTPPSPIAKFLGKPDIKDSYQILYKTTNSFNQSIATALTVLVPPNADFNKVISYQVFQDDAFIECSPSFALQETGFKFRDITIQFEFVAAVGNLLSRGWIAILPDHEGPNAAFLANRLAAHAVLDGIRAATRSGNITGIAKDPRVVLWGYSGGAVATGWAVEQQPSYAPELNIAGAAYGGILSNLLSGFGAVDGTIFAGLAVSALVGLSHEYEQIDDMLNRHVLPKYKPLILHAKKQCLVDNAVESLFRDVRGIVDDRSIWTKDPFVSVLKENDMGKAIPKIPLYIYHGMIDQVSPLHNTDVLVRNYCQHGAKVEYIRLHRDEHLLSFITGFPGALSWLINIMDGNIFPVGCKTKNLSLSPTDSKVTKLVDSSLIIDLLRSFKIS